MCSLLTYLKKLGDHPVTDTVKTDDFGIILMIIPNTTQIQYHFSQIHSFHSPSLVDAFTKIFYFPMKRQYLTLDEMNQMVGPSS